MKRIFLAALGSALLAGCGDPSRSPLAPDGALRSASTQTTNITNPYSETIFVPCAVGGAGEFVTLSGTLHGVFRITIDANGGFHARNLSQLQQVSGVGLTTGDRYRGTGVIQDSFHGTVGEVFTLVTSFQVIGQGADNNFVVHHLVHLTVNANGTVTASINTRTVDCR
jgi:hypothetical protein